MSEDPKRRAWAHESPDNRQVRFTGGRGQARLDGSGGSHGLDGHLIDNGRLCSLEPAKLSRKTGHICSLHLVCGDSIKLLLPTSIEGRLGEVAFGRVALEGVGSAQMHLWHQCYRQKYEFSE